MKKFYFALAAVAAFFAGCSNEVEPEQPTPVIVIEKNVSLSASVGDPLTKVSSDNAGIFKWQSTDKITAVTNGNAIRQFEVGDIEAAGTSAVFNGSVPDGSSITYALYPASKSHNANGDNITFHLDENVTWKADASGMPMIATVVGDEASFKSVGGVLKLILFNIPADADYLKFSASTQITGDFNIADASVEAPVIATSTSDGNNELVIDFSANYSASKVFYIPLPTGEIGTFSVSLYETLSSEPLYTVTSTKKSLNIDKANKLIIAPVMNCASTPGPIDATLANSDFNSVSGSYETGSITNASGTWNYNACTQTSNNVKYLQLRKNNTVSFLQLPSFSGNIESIVLEDVHNGSGAAYSGVLYLRSAANNDADPLVSAEVSLTSGDDYTFVIPNNVDVQTGYLMTSAGLRFKALTVKFRGGYTAPVITADTDELIFEADQESKNVTVGLVNAIDELGIGALVSGTNKDNFTAAIEGNILTVTAVAQNLTKTNYTATVTLRASGATAKTISITQESSLTPTANPSISCSSNTITITCATEGATIYYEIGENEANTPDPTDASAEYDADNKPTIDANSYVKAYAIADGYAASEIVGQAVNYVAPGTDVIYEKYRGALTEGSYIVSYFASNTYYHMANSANGNRILYTNDAVDNDQIINPDASIVWTIAQSGDYWTIYNSSSGYAGGTTSKNQGAILNSVTDYALWSVESDANTTAYDFVNKGRENGSSDTGNKYLRCNTQTVSAGTGRFACYANGTGGALTLYKLQDNTVWDLKSIAVKTEPKKTYEAGEIFDPTGLIITATYEDNAGVKADKTVDVAYSNETSSAFTFNPSTSTELTTSDESVSISYTVGEITKSTTQAITVTAPVTWDLNSIAVTTAPTKTTYTAGEFFDPTGLVVTPTFEEHGNTSNTKVGDPVDNANLEFTPSTSTALTTENTSVRISYTVNNITKYVDQIITVNAASAAEWVETALSDISAGDVFVIVGNNGSNYAMSNDKGTGSAPSAVAVTISGTKLTGSEGNNVIADKIKWNVSGNASDGYVFYPNGSTTTWLYTTTGNNGLRVGDSANKTIHIADNGYMTINDGSNTRYIGIYNSADWRSYTSNGGNIANQTFKFYKYIDNTPRTITVSTPSNGTVTTDPSGTTTAGTTVNITANPSTGYSVRTVSVVDGNSAAVSVTTVDDTHYRFSMPSSDATVTVTFGIKNDVSIEYGTNPANGSISISPASPVFEGETVTVTATPDDGYELNALTYNDGSAHDILSGKTFTMPATAVTVTATFAAVPTISVTNPITDVSATAGTYTINNAYTLLNNATSANVTVAEPDNTVVTAVSKGASDGSISITVSGNTGAARDGSFKIKYGDEAYRTITVNQLAGSTGGTVIFTPSSRTAVNVTGDKTGITATYSNTYTNTNQITKNNSCTLTISGLGGKTITAISINARNNKSSGSGTLTITTGSTNIINSYTLTGLGDTYTNIPLTVVSGSVASSATVVMSINCSANSTFFDSLSITYE